jgi:hypothetical protein
LAALMPGFVVAPLPCRMADGAAQWQQGRHSLWGRSWLAVNATSWHKPPVRGGTADAPLCPSRCLVPLPPSPPASLAGVSMPHEQQQRTKELNAVCRPAATAPPAHTRPTRTSITGKTGNTEKKSHCERAIGAGLVAFALGVPRHRARHLTARLFCFFNCSDAALCLLAEAKQ